MEPASCLRKKRRSTTGSNTTASSSGSDAMEETFPLPPHEALAAALMDRGYTACAFGKDTGSAKDEPATVVWDICSLSLDADVLADILHKVGLPALPLTGVGMDDHQALLIEFGSHYAARGVAHPADARQLAVLFDRATTLLERLVLLGFNEDLVDDLLANDEAAETLASDVGRLFTVCHLRQRSPSCTPGAPATAAGAAAAGGSPHCSEGMPAGGAAADVASATAPKSDDAAAGGAAVDATDAEAAMAAAHESPGTAETASSVASSTTGWSRARRCVPAAPFWGRSLSVWRWQQGRGLGAVARGARPQHQHAA